MASFRSHISYYFCEMNIIDFSFLEASSIAGLFATALLTLNLLLGMLVSTDFKKSQYFQRLPKQLKTINLLELHNKTAYFALGMVILHPVLLVLDKSSKFTLVDVLLPINAPFEKFYVAFGTISLYLLLLVVISSQKKVKQLMGLKTWKYLHFASYLTAILFTVHGIMLDPELKNRPVDFLDAEKLVSEMCLLVLIIATVLRFRYQLKR